MKTRSLQINHPSELNSLTTPRLFRKPGRGTIRLSPEFQHLEKEQWEADINRYYYACGCSSGAKGLLVLLVLGLGVSVAAYFFGALSLNQLVALPIATAILGAVIGKFSGLATARRRLTRVVHTVQANWKPMDKAERPIVSCG
ncbi:MAG: hypothetical protein WAU45_07130 [Blastocatellia bacterium]